MAPDLSTLEKSVWFLVGPYGTAETVRSLPIYSVPFVIGRREDLSLALSGQKVSLVHAAIIAGDRSLELRDLGSSNGTYVNGHRLTGTMELHDNDLVQFADMAFRVRRQASRGNSPTVVEDAGALAAVLVQFDKLMAEHAVTPFFQPIVLMSTRDVEGYEVLARSQLVGLETPKEMFDVARQLNLEAELSVMLRWEGVRASLAMTGPPHLFLNIHPNEMEGPGLVDSLQALRGAHPSQRLTLEINESAVANAAWIAEIRPALAQLNIGLAYDDFGAGQSRLNELSDGWPNYVKFDMSLIRNLHAASLQRQQMVASLVQIVGNLGIRSLAEGVETEAESETCRQMGFDLGQGYLYGRPAPPRVT